MKKKFNIILIHPGIQYTYRIASALSGSSLFQQVSLYTWFTLSHQSFFANYSYFKKRVKDINKNVKLYNYPIFELLLVIYLKILSQLNLEKGHTPRYKMQVLFGYFLLPLLYFNRKNTIVVLSETAAWPMAYYAKKWHIPVIMDFPSISHEIALKAEIPETNYGIKIKTLERQQIDFAINCSAFAASTYQGLTSAKKHYPIWLAANEQRINDEANLDLNQHLHICCLANTEKRKGIDLLLMAFSLLRVDEKKLYLIGKINPDWVQSYCKEHDISVDDIVLTGAISQQEIANYLIKEKVNLHILPSRFDSFGMVVAETMMLGIPNIVSPFVGAGEMLADGVNGFLMKDLSVEAILKEIDQFMALNPAEKLALKVNVLTKAKEMTWEHYNERVTAVFEEILKEISQ